MAARNRMAYSRSMIMFPAMTGRKNLGSASTIATLGGLIKRNWAGLKMRARWRVWGFFRSSSAGQGPATFVAKSIQQPNQASPSQQHSRQQPLLGLVLRFDPAAAHPVVLRHRNEHVPREGA